MGHYLSRRELIKKATLAAVGLPFLSSNLFGEETEEEYVVIEGTSRKDIGSLEHLLELGSTSNPQPIIGQDPDLKITSLSQSLPETLFNLKIELQNNSNAEQVPGGISEYSVGSSVILNNNGFF